MSPPRPRMETSRACGRKTGGGKMPPPSRRTRRATGRGTVRREGWLAIRRSRVELNVRVSARVSASTGTVRGDNSEESAVMGESEEPTPRLAAPVANHVQVRDAVLHVRLPRLLEAEPSVKPREVRLRADLH